jgi:hypothetical protein
VPVASLDAAGAKHRKVLPFLGGRRVRVVEAAAHRHSVERVLVDTPVAFGHLQSDRLEDRRHDVSAVVVLVSHLALGLDALGPVDDQRIARAACVLRIAFEHLERPGDATAHPVG